MQCIVLTLTGEQIGCACHMPVTCHYVTSWVKVDRTTEFDVTRHCMMLHCVHWGCSTLIIFVQIFKVYLLTMNNHPTTYYDCHSGTVWVIWEGMILPEMLLWRKHLTYWPEMYSGHLLTSDHDKHSYPVTSLSLKNLRYYADMFLHINIRVTLTFDQLTSKFVGVIYWSWPVVLPSTMTSFKNVSGYWADTAFA